MYSAEVLAALQHPRHAGALAAPAALARRDNPACGDTLQFALALEAGRLAAVRFQVQGCVSAIAAAETLAALAEGQTPAAARALTRADLLRALGGLPAASGHAADLALETLAAALAQLPPESAR
jgi:nitrogen fixation NifU-like protein